MARQCPVYNGTGNGIFTSVTGIDIGKKVGHVSSRADSSSHIASMTEIAGNGCG